MLSEVTYDGKRYTYRNVRRLIRALCADQYQVVLDAFAWRSNLWIVVIYDSLHTFEASAEGTSMWDALSKAVVELQEAGDGERANAARRQLKHVTEALHRARRDAIATHKRFVGSGRDDGLTARLHGVTWNIDDALAEVQAMDEYLRDKEASDEA